MKGYLKNPAATTKALREMEDGTWLFTGDTAMYDENGFIYFLDRSHDIIKRGGENISTAEVESVIAGLAGVADICIVGLPDSIRDEIVAAAVVSEPDVKLTAIKSVPIVRHTWLRIKFPSALNLWKHAPNLSR